MKELRIIIFIAEMNGLELYGADIGNAYLEPKTKKKVCFVAGKEFGDYKGHLLLINKALYGLKTSGKRWYERLADCLREMGFEVSKASPCIWIRADGELYEYIAVYVDDLAIAAKNAKEIIRCLKRNTVSRLNSMDLSIITSECNSDEIQMGHCSNHPRST